MFANVSGICVIPQTEFIRPVFCHLELSVFGWNWVYPAKTWVYSASNWGYPASNWGYPVLILRLSGCFLGLRVFGQNSWVYSAQPMFWGCSANFELCNALQVNFGICWGQHQVRSIEMGLGQKTCCKKWHSLFRGPYSRCCGLHFSRPSYRHWFDFRTCSWSPKLFMQVFL